MRNLGMGSGRGSGALAAAKDACERHVHGHGADVCVCCDPNERRCSTLSGKSIWPRSRAGRVASANSCTSRKYHSSPADPLCSAIFSHRGGGTTRSTCPAKGPGRPEGAAARRHRARPHATAPRKEFWQPNKDPNIHKILVRLPELVYAKSPMRTIDIAASWHRTTHKFGRAACLSKMRQISQCVTSPDPNSIDNSWWQRSSPVPPRARNSIRPPRRPDLGALERHCETRFSPNRYGKGAYRRRALLPLHTQKNFGTIRGPEVAGAGPAACCNRKSTLADALVEMFQWRNKRPDDNNFFSPNAIELQMHPIKYSRSGLGHRHLLHGRTHGAPPATADTRDLDERANFYRSGDAGLFLGSPNGAAEETGMRTGPNRQFGDVGSRGVNLKIGHECFGDPFVEYLATLSPRTVKSGAVRINSDFEYSRRKVVHRVVEVFPDVESINQVHPFSGGATVSVMRLIKIGPGVLTSPVWSGSGKLCIAKKPPPPPVPPPRLDSCQFDFSNPRCKVRPGSMKVTQTEKVKCHRSDGPDRGQEAASREGVRRRETRPGYRTALALESVGRRRGRRRTRAAASSRRADTLHSALQPAPATPRRP
ncbi:hypothetical protein GEV33_008624 [Tenebrio molitor]|uniref:Uncharacterized protein n=1 Tax=Tenebrio molitor TaxID=7067 RepID=A0A8J6H8R6_TENMO|nr:hypothetical protein GEV33_008624 [Tenebrio molitor]